MLWVLFVCVFYKLAPNVCVCVRVRACTHVCVGLCNLVVEIYHGISLNQNVLLRTIQVLLLFPIFSFLFFI